MPKINETPELINLTDDDWILGYDHNDHITGKIKLSTLKEFIGVPALNTPIRIEAENYITMSGIQTENCSEGGLSVGYINNGDWMDYSATVPTTGNYKFTFRLASAQSGGQFQLKLNNTILTTVNAPNSGGFQTWQSVEATNINLTAGSQTLRILSVAEPYWNINWFEFVKV